MKLPYLEPVNPAHADGDRQGTHHRGTARELLPDWTHGQSYTAYGVRFGLRTNDARALADARAYLPPGWVETENGEVDVLYSLAVMPGELRLYAGEELIASREGHAWQALAEHAQWQTALGAREALFVHAGVVGWQGGAIVMPGRSYSGKTTLVHALVRAGATYYSDEFAVLDRQGRVHPYALALSIRDRNGRGVKTAVEHLGGARGSERLPVTMVVLTRYRRGARWRPRELPPAQGLLALMDNTVAARGEPEHSMPILKAAVVGARVLQSDRGEASHAARALLELWNRHGPVPDTGDGVRR